MQKGRVKGIAQRGHTLSFGNFGIKSLEPGWITSRQIEAARIAMTRAMKREGQVWIRIFPDKPITKKPCLLTTSYAADESKALTFGEFCICRQQK